MGIRIYRRGVVSALRPDTVFGGVGLGVFGARVSGLNLSGPLDPHAFEEATGLLMDLPVLAAGQSIKRAYLHWIVSNYSDDDKAYNVTISLHQGKWIPVVDTDPKLNATEPPQAGYAAHTYQRNGNAAGLAVAAMSGANTDNFGPYAIQQHQVEVLCAATAAVCFAYAIDVAGTVNGEPTVMTHAEAAIKDGYYCGHTTDPDCRWDLERLEASSSPLTFDEAEENGELLRQRIREYKLALEAKDNA